MRAWWALYKKELYSIGFFSLVVFLLTFVWELFLFYKINSWPMGLSFGLSFLPLSFFPLLILWLGYNSYRQEWKDDTNYFILSIPRRGWEISLAKLLSSMTFYLAITISTFLLIYIFQQGFIKSQILLAMSETTINGSLLNNLIIKAILLYWISGLFIYIMTQFSQIISLYFDRFRGVITIIVFIFAHYLVFRGASILSPLFRWLPDFSVRSINVIENGLVQDMIFYIGSGPIISSVLLLFGLFFLGSWIVENQLEV